MSRVFIFLMLAASAAGQTTVTLKGVQYTMKGHPRVWLDGPNGPITTSVKDSGPSGRANDNHVPWVALKNNNTAFLSGSPPAYQGLNTDYGRARFLLAALRWFADNTQTEARSAAIWGINHIEDAFYGSTACDETLTYCNGRHNVLDYSSLNVGDYVATLYSLMRSELSSEERQTFANKMLNDLGTSCSKPLMYTGSGTITTTSGSTTVTGSGTQFTTELAVGDTIFDTVNRGSRRVASIQSNTQLTIHAAAGSDFSFSNRSWRFGKKWKPGDCGWLWFVKHHDASPLATTADYPPAAGTYAFGAGNLTITKLYSFILIGLALADDDERARTLLTQAYNYWYDNSLSYAKDLWTGFTQSGAYYARRTHHMMPMIAAAIERSVNNPPNLTSGLWTQRLLPYIYYTYLPNPTSSRAVLCWGDSGGCVGYEATHSGAWVSPMSIHGNSDEAKYANYWMRNVWGKWNTTGLSYNNGAYISWNFVNADPTLGQLDTSSLPTQYLFRSTDDAECASTGFSCLSNRQYSNIISRTGWASASDTFFGLLTQDYWEPDHVYRKQIGGYRLFKKVYLMGGDASTLNGSGGGELGIEIGNTDNFNDGKVSGVLVDGEIVRWAGVNPTGDPQSRYVYALADLKGAYKAATGITRANRHFLHFKRSGTQDYILLYDDIDTGTTGQTLKAYLHYTQNAQSGEGTTSCDGGDCNTSKAITSRTSAANNASVLTRVLAPGGASSLRFYTDNANGSYTGGAGYTFRATICASADGSTCNASATAGEWIVVHKPVANLTDTMPAVNLLSSITSGWRGVQIEDAAPRVAIIKSGSSAAMQVTFTTTHSGTAQYVVAGLAEGTGYTVTRDGSPIISEGMVGAGDNTLYFESAAGTFSISGKVAPLSIITTSLPQGTEGVAYSENLSATGGASPYTWGIVSGALCEGLSLSSAGLLSGIPRRAETCNFTVRVTDGSAATATQALSITIQPAPAQLRIVAIELPNATEGASYTQTLQATGGASPYTWRLEPSSTLPSGLALNSDGVISGIPSAPTGGVHEFTVEVADSGSPQQTAYRAFSITVNSSVALLQIEDTVLPNGEVGAPYSHTLTATGGAPPYTWSLNAGVLPYGLALSMDGSINGIPVIAGHEASFGVLVADSGTPSQTAQRDLMMSIDAPSLGLEMLHLGSNKVVVRYGKRSMDAAQSCRLDLSPDGAFAEVIESFTDSGGPAKREHVFGESTALQEGTLYYARGTCGAEVTWLEFRTGVLAACPAAKNVAVSVRGPTRADVDNVLIEYGTSPSPAGAMTLSCASGCIADLELNATGVVYVKRSYRDATNRVLALGTVKAMAIPCGDTTPLQP